MTYIVESYSYSFVRTPSFIFWSALLLWFIHTAVGMTELKGSGP
jgi:hypothetical protein